MVVVKLCFVFLIGSLAPPQVQGGPTILKITLNRVDLEYLNKSLAYVTASTYKLNRTTNALNATFRFFEDLDKDKSLVYVTGYQWKSNEFRLGPVQFADKFSHMITSADFDMPSLMREHTTPPMLWPVKRNVTYHHLGWVPNSKKFPPWAPEGKWKLVSSYYYDDQKQKRIVDVAWYVTIDLLIPWE